MIKFFRKLRQNSLMENKTGKYLKYAIGEIVLVVISILIALWINTKNQERIKQEKIDSILVKIQNDLLQDIKSGEYLINSYVKKDSLIDSFIGRKLTPEIIRSTKLTDSYAFEAITIWSYAYKLQDNGYKQLMNILDDLPKKYDPLIKTLNDNFSDKQTTFNRHNTSSDDAVRNYKQYLANNHSWMAPDLAKNKISDAQIDYMINNSRFKNQMVLVLKSRQSLVFKYSEYRKVIMDTYIMINELLGENASAIPKTIRTTSLDSEKAAERLVGIYQLKSGPKKTRMGEQFEIYRKGKNLFLITEDKKTFGPLLFMKAEKPWFIININGFEILRFDYNGKNTLKIVNHDENQTHWVKEVNE